MTPDGTRTPTRTSRARWATAVAAAGATLALALPLPGAAAAEAATLPDGLTRAGGANRIDTALLVSQELRPDAGSAPAAVIASSGLYADSIGGSRLASAAQAPLLLTPPQSLTPAVAREVRRVVAPGGTVYVLGGTAALSAGVEASLRALDGSYDVVRLSGSDRYATAVAIADEVTSLTGDTGPVYLTTGAAFPDGLVAAPLAAHTGGVVVLSDGDYLPSPTVAYLALHDPDRTRTVPVGGPAAVARPSAGRAIVGTDRYDTAAKVAARFTDGDDGSTTAAVGLAAGSTTWPDALVGGAAMGALGGPLLLSDGGALGSVDTAAVQGLVQRNASLTAALVVGGTSAIPDATATELGDLLP